MSVRLTRLLCVALVAALGCAVLAGRPAPLLEQGRDALARGEYATAYDRFAEIRSHHPESAEAREAFPLAALALRRLWFAHRFKEPSARWLASEPAFMYAWLESFFQGDVFPHSEAAALFRGMPHGFFADFVQYSKSRPGLARWKLRATDDNGIVETVSAER